MFGWHIAKGEGFSKSAADAAEYIRQLGLSPVVQVFATGPLSARVNIAREPIGTPAVIHGAYIDNPWSRGVIGNITTELELSEVVGAAGVVIHLAAKAADESSLAAVVRALAGWARLHPGMHMVWLEINTAKPGPTTFETPAKLRWLFERVDSYRGDAPIRFGLCVDTAHLWSCGVSFAEYGPAAAWLAEVHTIGVPIMFHLNDSAREFASGVDSHAMLGTGNIWRGVVDWYASGVWAVIEYALEHNSMVILERKTSRPDADLRLVAEIVAGGR